MAKDFNYYVKKFQERIREEDIREHNEKIVN